MMFLPNPDGFLSSLQSDGIARVTITASDDLAIVVDAIRSHAATLAVDVRIWQRLGGVLLVEAKDLSSREVDISRGAPRAIPPPYGTLEEQYEYEARRVLRDE